MHYRHSRIGILAIFVGTTLLWGCSDEPSTNTTSSASSSSSGQGGEGGTGGTGGTGGMGGSGGQGGGAVATPGAPGQTLVSAGQTVRSSKYRMVFSMGQSSPAQGSLQSSKYKINGGFIGATGSPK